MNAKEELVGDLRHHDNSIILCADITYEPEYNREIRITLPLNYTGEQLTEFLDKLDFDYDDYYGTQYLFGIIWLHNGAWLERAEYDGKEWWDFKQTPAIPDYLKSNRNHWELV